MFLDLKSSTHLAETLEHVTCSRLIQDCYAELTAPLLDYNAQVYQYVGDEVVVTRLDHDGNIRPWVHAAEAVGANVRWVGFDRTTAELTVDDVRVILDLQLEYFKAKGVSQNGSTSNPIGPVVIGGSETVSYILEQAAARGEEFTAEQVHAVVETQLVFKIATPAMALMALLPEPKTGEVVPAGK